MAAEPMPGIDRNDPGYQRHCIGTDCRASFNVLDAMDGAVDMLGWRILRRVVSGYICPVHAGPFISGEHLPSWIPGEDGKVTGCRCTCGWSWSPEVPTTQGEYQAEFMEHIAEHLEAGNG